MTAGKGTTAAALVCALTGIAGAQSEIVFPGAEWAEAPPASQGLDGVRLEAAIAYMDAHFGAEGARQLAIVRNGCLVWKGPEAGAYHELYSATKVFTSTALGVLVGDGRCALNARAAEYIPGLADAHPAYARIRLRDLATMTGGYHGEVADVGPGQDWGDPISYVTTPGAPEFEPAGSQIAYNDHDVHLLGWILARCIAHETLEDLFARRVAGPIGMTRWEWAASGTVDGMVHCNAAGTPALAGDGGVRTTPLDLARLGLLYLAGGSWAGKQLLSAAFVDEATSSLVPATMPGRSRSLLSGAYGMYWWTNGVMASGYRRWPSAPANAYAAHGAGTNFCIVIPEWSMVIARMGAESVPGTYSEQDVTTDAFLGLVGAALVPEPAGPESEAEARGDGVFPGADWHVAPPASQGIDPERLEAAVADLTSALRDWGGADTLFIVRGGRVIWAGPEADKEYQIFSATKSFTSTCLGLMVEEGRCTLETRAADHMPDLADRYPGVTLRHFATMTSGYDATPVGYEVDAEGRGDSWTPDPSADPLFAPGARFRYWDEAMMKFGNTLVSIGGQPLDELFRARIADPIQMTRWRWDAGNWTGGVHTSSRELARFGLLMLNRGNWDGRQLVSAGWVDQATSVQVPRNVANDGLPRSRGAGVYGYNWWVNGVRPDGKLLWPDAPAGAYYANGLHNNVCVVVPGWDMVIARTNGPRADGSTSSPPNVDEVWSAFLGQVGQALRVQTEVSIRDEAFLINGQPTYEGRTWRGHTVEGLLMNARMVQGIFDDLNPETVGRWAYPDTGVWDADRNTREFVAAMPKWRECGLLAFTINLQGGSPEGYSAEQPWHNSAITEDGSLRPEYMGRLERILDRADALGMVAILGVFYFGQDQRLRDEAAVDRALDSAVQWILDRGYRNVLIEVNNECDVQYDHAILQPARVHELIERVKTHTRNGRRLLVSTSYGGGAVPRENVVRAADFLVLHGNGVGEPTRLAEMVRETRGVAGYRPMPILVSEDDHFDFDRPLCNMTAAIGEYCSWGYFDPGANDYEDGYQSVPTNWGINTDRKHAFFGKLREITGL